MTTSKAEDELIEYLKQKSEESVDQIAWQHALLLLEQLTRARNELETAFMFDGRAFRNRVRNVHGNLTAVLKGLSQSIISRTEDEQ